MVGAKTGGPWLISAILCQAVVAQAGGRTDLVGLLDQIVVSRDQLPQTVRVHMAFAMYGGLSHRKHRLEIRPVSSSGIGGELRTAELDFTRDPLVRRDLQFDLIVTEIGEFRFEVTVDGELVTRVPIFVGYLPTGSD